MFYFLFWENWKVSFVYPQDSLNTTICPLVVGYSQETFLVSLLSAGVSAMLRWLQEHDIMWGSLERIVGGHYFATVVNHLVGTRNRRGRG